MEIVSTVLAVITGAVLVSVGVFSIISLWWGDLLESEPSEGSFSKAA